MESIELYLKNALEGMAQIGACHTKTDGEFAYFDIERGSKMDNEANLKKLKEVLAEPPFPLKLKIRKIDPAK